MTFKLSYKKYIWSSDHSDHIIANNRAETNEPTFTVVIVLSLVLLFISILYFKSSIR